MIFCGLSAATGRDDSESTRNAPYERRRPSEEVYIATIPLACPSCFFLSYYVLMTMPSSFVHYIHTVTIAVAFFSRGLCCLAYQGTCTVGMGMGSLLSSLPSDGNEWCLINEEEWWPSSFPVTSICNLMEGTCVCPLLVIKVHPYSWRNHIKN